MISKQLKLLNLEPDGYAEEANEILNRLMIVDHHELSRKELIASIKNYDFLIVRLKHQIDKSILGKAIKLKAIISATTGLNHIDIAECEKRNIEILSLKDEYDFLNDIYATAEYTWALLMAVVRNLPSAYNQVLEGGWDRDRFKGIELQGKTLGIIGLGRLGQKVANYGLAFGMNVIASELNRSINIKGVSIVSQEELLRRSDIISLHVDYNESNAKMIDAKLFNKMKNGVIFINTARGELVDEDALLYALETSRVRAAGLDVLAGESMDGLNDNKLIEYAKKNGNLIVTPHIGGATYESMRVTEIFMAEKLLRYIEEKKNGYL